MARRRVAFICLDGVPLSALRKAARDAAPALSSRIDRGRHVALRFAYPPAAIPAWATCLTGRSPDAHGITESLRLAGPGVPQAAVAGAADLRAENLFSIAARQDRAIVALNFPLTGPAAEPVGSPPGATVIPSGLSKRLLSRGSTPPEVIQRLKGVPDLEVDRLSVNSIDEANAVAAWEAGDAAAWRDLMMARDQAWSRAAAWLGKNEPADLLAVNLEGWGSVLRLSDGPSPGLSGGGARGREPGGADPDDPTNAVHLRGLQTLLEGIGAGSAGVRIFLASSYALVPSDRIIYLNVCLERLGYLTWGEGAPVRAGESDGLNLTPRKASLPIVDFEGSAAFCADGSTGSIHLTTAAADRARLRAEIASGLERMVDPEGAPLFRRVIAGEVLLPGRPSGRPDLFALPAERASLSTERADETVRDRHRPIGVPSSNGWLLALGETDGPEPTGVVDGDLLDIAPTLLHALGLPVPADLEGAVRAELFTAREIEEVPVRIGEKTLVKGGAASARDGITPADSEAEIYRRLKSLGYVE